ncbi:WD40 repeat-like protein [Neoconidiobolus thromboides FSU 785]|nr:WD40 repeat-like protein [Neoconidiobolus thromboides FSU 785]
MASNEENISKVQVKLFTRNEKYPLPDAPLFLPTNLKRYGLSEIVNHLLALERPVPFEFLYQGDFIKSSLSTFMSIKNLSTEALLEIEVIESTLPPSQLNDYKHDDWVSSINISSQGLILTGSYDNLVRVWDKSSQCIATLKGHNSTIKSVKWVENGEISFLTASQDQTVIAWKKDEKDNYAPFYTAKGHKKSIESVSISANNKNFATASSDSTIQIWSLASLEEDPEHVIVQEVINSGNKKRKNSEMAFKGSKLTLNGHFGPVQCLEYCNQDSNILYSGGFDHSLKIWDLITATNIHSKTCEKPFLSLSQASGSDSLLASGHTDSIIRIWDPRVKESNVVKLTLSGHLNFVSSVKFHNSDSFRLASSSYDGSLKIWDLRSRTPQFSLSHSDTEIKKFDPRTVSNEHPVFENKVLSMDWYDDILASGGEDSNLRLFKVLPNNLNQS